VTAAVPESRKVSHDWSLTCLDLSLTASVMMRLQEQNQCGDKNNVRKK
jgi:hypothetical protein